MPAKVSLSENVSVAASVSEYLFSRCSERKKQLKHVSKIEILFSERPTTTARKTTGMATLATCNCNHAMYSFCIRRLCVRLDWNMCVANTRQPSEAQAQDIDCPCQQADLPPHAARTPLHSACLCPGRASLRVLFGPCGSFSCLCTENVEIDIRWKENISIFTSCSTCFSARWGVACDPSQGSMNRTILLKPFCGKLAEEM